MLVGQNAKLSIAPGLEVSLTVQLRAPASDEEAVDKLVLQTDTCVASRDMRTPSFVPPVLARA